MHRGQSPPTILAQHCNPFFQRFSRRLPCCGPNSLLRKLLSVQVVVLEKGSYVRAQDLAGLEKDGYDTMYERAGLMMGTDDNGELPQLAQKHASAN